MFGRPFFVELKYYMANFDYRRNARYVFDLADGTQITGEFRHKLFYDETTGSAVESPTRLVRNCFFRVAENNPDFFNYETYFEVVNYEVGEAEANPVSTQLTADTLVAFSMVKEVYGTRSPLLNYRAVG